MNYNLSNLPIGIFNRFECQYLAELVSQVPDHGVIVEVGSLLGRTSVIIGRHAKENVKMLENMYGQKATIFPASTLWMIRKPQ